MLLPSRFYAAAVLCAILLPLAGQAFAKGIDTDATTTDLPFNVQGNLVMDMTGTGLAVGPSAVDLTTTGNVTATSSVNAPSVNATNVTATSAVSAGGNVSAGGAVTAVGNVTGANLVVSGAPAYPINNAGAYTVFDLATLGSCTANQALTKNANGSFACAQVSSLAATIPTCAAGYFLTFDGTAFSCANGASAASTVTSSAVLAALPQCSSGQTLLSNGNGGWSCGSPPPAAGNMISIPYNGQTYTVPAYVICPVNIGGNTVGVIAPLY